MGSDFSISRFSLHAVAQFMTPRNSPGFDALVNDLLSAGVSIVDLRLDELIEVTASMKRYQLDFDDAFNHVIAEKYDLTIVSFDADYDRTPRGRHTPAQILESLDPRDPSAKS